MAKKKKEDKDKSKEQSSKPPKKKRKVGRPKKRGRKKKYYKPKKKRKSTPQSRKGFGSNVSYNRVRSLLWANHKDDFTSYRDFISNKVDEDGKKIKGTSIVSQLYEQCKSLECSDEDILSIYRQFQTQDKGDPAILPSDYFVPRPYYELVTEDLWDGMDERLWVFSPMLLAPPPYFLGILGEDRCIDKDNNIKNTNDCDPEKGDKKVSGKKERFMPFVTYCNQFQQAGIYETSDEVPHIKFLGKTEDDLSPYWNEEMQRWEVQIVPCTPFGEIYDYDFNPDLITQDIPDEDELPIIQKPEDKPIYDVPTEATEQAIKLEQEKQKTLAQAEKTALAQAKLEEKKIIADITAQWMRGDITKKEMMELIKIIKD